MYEQRWVVVEVVTDDIQAEILRGLLVSQGIEAIISKEGAGHALGLTIGMMGESQILVPSGSKDHALQVLEDYRQGLFEDESSEENEADDNDSEENL